MTDSSDYNLGEFCATGASTSGQTALAVSVVLGYVFVIWNLGYRQGKTGSSIGKAIMKFKVVSERTGQPIGFWLSLVREVLYSVASYLCFILWLVAVLFPLWDTKRQSLADKIVTSVCLPLAQTRTSMTQPPPPPGNYPPPPPGDYPPPPRLTHRHRRRVILPTTAAWRLSTAAAWRLPAATAAGWLSATTATRCARLSATASGRLSPSVARWLPACGPPRLPTVVQPRRRLFVGVEQVQQDAGPLIVATGVWPRRSRAAGDHQTGVGRSLAERLQLQFGRDQLLVLIRHVGRRQHHRLDHWMVPLTDRHCRDSVGVHRRILDIANGQQVSMGSFFRPRYIGNVIIAGLIVGIVTTIGFILCIVPGVIASIMLMFTVVTLLDRNLSPVDAVKSSFDLSKATSATPFSPGSS